MNRLLAICAFSGAMFCQGQVKSPASTPLKDYSIYGQDPIRYDPVSQQVIENRLQKYGGNDKQREGTLWQLFSQAGCDDAHLSQQAVKGSKLSNVICILPGSTNRVVIVGAHFDHIPAGDGVVDNWSGAALLPSIYQALKSEPRKHTYIFIGFTDEERGEVGSRYYVTSMTAEQVATTDAMVNMDTLGLASTKIWASHSDNKLIAALGMVASLMKLPVSNVDVDQIGSTDSVQFSERKIPSITIHSLTQETWDSRILHTSKDRISAVHSDDYYETYRLVSAYLAYLDRSSVVSDTQVR
jgi:Zn-dependent M28 family amino/carboxypeptidase